MVKDKPEQNQPSELSAVYWKLTPLLGTGVFIILYLLATLLYPGGSQADKQAIGFSWLHNYWCNLLNVDAINGQPNPARPVAMLAMLVLCLSLAIFWYLVPGLFAFRKTTVKLVQIMGILSMVSASLIFTSYHDLVINLAAFLGLIPLLYTFIGLYRHHYKKLFWLGCSCFLLMGVNNYIYYTRDFIFFLPLIQKITLACFLGWISLLSVQIYKRRNYIL